MLSNVGDKLDSYGGISVTIERYNVVPPLKPINRHVTLELGVKSSELHLNCSRFLIFPSIRVVGSSRHLDPLSLFSS